MDAIHLLSGIICLLLIFIFFAGFTLKEYKHRFDDLLETMEKISGAVLKSFSANYPYIQHKIDSSNVLYYINALIDKLVQYKNEIINMSDIIKAQKDEIYNNNKKHDEIVNTLNLKYKYLKGDYLYTRRNSKHKSHAHEKPVAESPSKYYNKYKGYCVSVPLYVTARTYVAGFINDNILIGSYEPLSPVADELGTISIVESTETVIIQEEEIPTIMEKVNDNVSMRISQRDYISYIVVPFSKIENISFL